VTRPTDDTLLAFLEETLGDEESSQVRNQIASDPELATELEGAAKALEALRAMPTSAAPVTPASSTQNPGRGVSPWWIVAATLATLAVSIPVTLRLAGGETGDAESVPHQAVSLFGEQLYAPPSPSDEIRRSERLLATSPDDVELVLAAARAHTSALQFREAIDLYDRAIVLAPNDWRAYTFRGMRFASVREFTKAIPDLEQARKLAPLNYDISYYLGFVYFLNGRFDEAASEYLRCFEVASDPTARAVQSAEFRSCSEIADDVDWRVAITDWAVRALRRAGRDDEAFRLLDTITPGMRVESSLAYYHALLFYKGLETEKELLSLDEFARYSAETVGYAVANWYLIQGETARAVEILEDVAAHPRWSGFGRIAAEVDLARLRKQIP